MKSLNFEMSDNFYLGYRVLVATLANYSQGSPKI